MVEPTACRTVLYLIKVPSQVFLLANHSMYCGKKANFHSANVAFCLTCSLCEMQYADCTTKYNPQFLWIYNHKNCIRRGHVPRDFYRSYLHFASDIHTEKSLSVTILDTTPPTSLGDHKEVRIDRLLRAFPDGLNVNYRSNIIF